MLELLEELVMTPGISGYEDEIREKIRSKVEEYAPTTEDNMGNLIATLGKEGGRKVALVAHMDELGLVVSRIEDNGFLRIRKIGGIDDRVLVGRFVEIKTGKGIVPGVIGLKPPHLTLDPEEKKKVTSWEKLYLDVGTRSKRETERLGIRLLDPLVMKKHFCLLNGKIISTRGLDDRVGCAVLIEALRRVHKLRLKARISFIWSVQEELGLRGARVISNTLRPDLVFVLDTYSTTDAPDSPTHFVPVVLGQGPVIRMIDNRAMASPKLKDLVMKVATRNKIPIQIGITGGSTDGAALQEGGALMMPLGIPVRYTHSPTECGHLDDLRNLVKLMVKVIGNLNS